MTANVLRMSGVIEYCLILLKQLIPYWKKWVFIFEIIPNIGPFGPETVGWKEVMSRIT